MVPSRRTTRHAVPDGHWHSCPSGHGYCCDKLQLSARGRDLAQQAFTRGRKREIEVAEEIGRFLATYPRGGGEARKLHDALYRLAAADGRLQPREKAFLEDVTRQLGFTAEAH